MCKLSILTAQTSSYQHLLTRRKYTGIWICLHKYLCYTCLEYCNPLNSNQSIVFCELRAFEGSDELFGGLIVPPNNFRDYYM